MTDETADDPIYSPDPVEESRMLTIRDNAANRVAEMARCRVKFGRQLVVGQFEFVFEKIEKRNNIIHMNRY